MTGRDDSPKPRPLVIAVACGVAVTAGLMLLPIPLGLPGEWVWERRPLSIGWLLGTITASLLAAGYVAVADRIAAGISGPVPASRLAALTLAGFALIALLPVTLADGTGNARVPIVLYFPAFSGYFTEARTDERPVAAFLADYERVVAEGDYLHQGTHPPGLILLYRGAFAAVRHVPGLRTLLESMRLTSTEAAMQSLRELDPTLTPDDFAVLQLANIGTLLTAALVVVPLVRLLERVCRPSDAILAASLWPLVPALAIFSPKSDLLLPIVPLTVAALWVSAIDATTKRAVLRGAAAGAVAFCGLLISLAVLPAYVGVLIGSLVARPRPQVAAIAGGVVGFTLPVAIFAGFGCMLPGIWLGNAANHAAFYDHYPRSYWPWLAINELETGIAIGLPTITLGLFGRARPLPSTGPSVRIVFGVVAAWIVLALSGRNLSEVARLWIVLFPWLIAAIVVFRGGLARKDWLVVASGLVVTTPITVHTVDGFNLTRFFAG